MHIKTYGADPEVMIVLDNQLKSSIGLIQGTKEDPSAIAIPGCAQLTDNVLVEFTVPPSPNFYEVLASINDCKEWTTDYLKDLTGGEVELQYRSSGVYDDQELDHPEAREFGCSPSKTIYEKGYYMIPMEKRRENLRSAGFHIHFGLEGAGKKLTKEEITRFVFLFDLVVTIPMMIFDTDRERSKLYGQLGDYRDKPYGVECRALGSATLNFQDELQNKVERLNTLLPYVDELHDSLFEDIKAIRHEIFKFNDEELNEYLIHIEKTIDRIVPEHLIFVYGTLKEGYGNHRRMGSSEKLGRAVTKQKCTLFASGIPFLNTRIKTHKVAGELYKVPSDLLPNIDSLEGHPRWYKREPILVELDGNIVLAETYSYNLNDVKRYAIETSDTNVVEYGGR